MSASDQPTDARELCGKWMPRAQTNCARGVGHAPPCAPPQTLESWRKHARARRAAGLRESPELRKKHNRKARIAAYGLTEEDFARLLAVQGNACGMCHEPFEDGQLIHIDHDHCDTDCRSCGDCVRGLLCHTCNVALGHIERRYALARAYLDNPPAIIVVVVGGRGFEPLTSAL